VPPARPRRSRARRRARRRARARCASRLQRSKRFNRRAPIEERSSAARPPRTPTAPDPTHQYRERQRPGDAIGNERTGRSETSLRPEHERRLQRDLLQRGNDLVQLIKQHRIKRLDIPKRNRDIDTGNYLLNRPRRRVIPRRPIAATARRPLGHIERNTRQRPPHLPRKISIVLHEQFEKRTKRTNDLKNEIVNTKHDELRVRGPGIEARPRTRARRAGPGCELREHRAKRGCGLEAPEHTGTIAKPERTTERADQITRVSVQFVRPHVSRITARYAATETHHESNAIFVIGGGRASVPRRSCDMEEDDDSSISRRRAGVRDVCRHDVRMQLR